MNFRVYLSFFNGVTFEIVNDPSIPFYIKPPYDMALETNLEKVVGTAKPESDLFASVSDTIGNDALSPAYLHKDNKIEISEYKASPKAPEDDLSEFSKFSITDVRDGDLFIPYTDKLRKNSFSLKILNKYPELAYANDPNLAVEHKKIIDERRTTRCSDFFGKKITEAKLNSGVLSSGISKQLAKQATEIAANNSFGLIGQMAIGSLIAKGQESLEKTFEQNIQDNIDENPNYCSTITGAGYGYKSGVTVGRDDMAPLSKIFGHELPFILRSEVGGYNLAIPPSAGESNGIASGLFSIVGRNSGSQDYTMQFVSTNPRFYEMDENRKSFGDRIQYLGMDLRKLEYPNQPSINWNYDNDCRKFQITSSQSPDEAKVFPGNEAKIYVVNSAFIRCPAFSPMNEFSIPGWPKSLTKEFFEVMFDMLSALGIDVGVEPFDERYY
jgi:hypothetical protein